MNKKFLRRAVRQIRLAPRWTRIAAIVIILLVAGQLLGIGPLGKKKEQPKPVPVEQEIEGTVSASGELRAKERVLLHFQTAGKLVWLGVDEGNKVRKWQGVAQLDTTKLNSDLQRALSDLRTAEATLERVYDEVKEHKTDETFAQKEKRTIAEVAKDKAYEVVIKAQQDLKDAILISPIDGIVVDISEMVVGENVTVTDTIKIVGIDGFVFRAFLDEVDFQSVKLGQAAKVTLDAFPDEEFTGEVTYIGAATTKTPVGVTVIPVEVNLTSDERFIDGLSGDVELEI